MGPRQASVTYVSEKSAAQANDNLDFLFYKGNTFRIDLERIDPCALFASKGASFLWLYCYKKYILVVTFDAPRAYCK